MVVVVVQEHTEITGNGASTVEPRPLRSASHRRTLKNPRLLGTPDWHLSLFPLRPHPSGGRSHP